MSVVDEIRTKIVAALPTLTGLTNVPVVATAAPDDWLFYSTRTPVVLVIYTGLEESGPSPIVPRGLTQATLNWLLIVISTDFQSGKAAQVKTLGADAIAESVRAIRNTEIGPAANPKVFLRLRGESLVEHPERNAAGGPVAYFCTYQTSPLYV